MRTVLIVLLAIGLFAVAMPATVSAGGGATYCYVNDVGCMIKCETRSTIGSVTGNEHECYIWG